MESCKVGCFGNVAQRWIALMAVVAMVAGCAAYAAPGPKTQVGAATGAAGGGLLAASIDDDAESILAGVLLGALVGGAVGNALDNADRQYASRNTQYALEKNPSGRTSKWHNPDSGHSGTTTPIKTLEPDPGVYCREFQQTVTVGGRTEQAYGTACRQPDGDWRIKS